MTLQLKPLSASLLAISVILLPACEGDDGDPGPPGPNAINLSTASAQTLGDLDVVSQVMSVSVNSPPRVRFSLKTANDVPLVGLVPLWEASNRFVRFTITKLVPGTAFPMSGGGRDPDRWVAYVLDGGEPDYDTGSSLVDHNDGTYTFTFNTDVRSVPGVTYEPTRTHRVAGQIGSGSVALEPQNLWLDFVPTGAAVTRTRAIATMDSCNECHDDLVFHGRRFEVEYCVQCHNSDLAVDSATNPMIPFAEGDLAFMIHRIHASGDFNVLDGGIDYAEVTYPQDLANCRKCHNEDDASTPEASNWRTLPNIQACDGCHNVFSTNSHSGPNLTDNMLCVQCHGPGAAEEIEMNHTLPNNTPNNPGLLAGQRDISYEMMSASVAGSNDVTVDFKVLSDGVAIDPTNLPADMLDGSMEAFRYPAFLLAWALPQDGIMEPADWNNIGERAAQPLSLDLGDFMPIEMVAPIGTLSYNAVSGVTTATITDAASQFPVGSTLRTVALQGYFQQDLSSPLDGTSDVSLHALSGMVTVMGDDVRREIVDSAKCGACHEWFEGHGGNRNFGVDANGVASDVICGMCHNPNQSSSGRTVTDPTARGLDAALMAAITAGTLDPMVDPNDPLTYPEDVQNLKDMIHAIHASDDRTRPFQHIRGPGRQGYYDWSEVTFPRGASTSNCTLCHMDDTYALPLDGDALATTVRTTSLDSGIDPNNGAVEMAFQNVPNTSDWVNTPGAASCFQCHTSTAALAHMTLNGAFLSDPRVGGDGISNRMLLGTSIESCAVCHGPGKSVDIEEAHDL